MLFSLSLSLFLSLSLSLFLSLVFSSIPLLQFFSIALAHFYIHCLLFQSSSPTALNRSWNDQNTIWCLQNDTTFSKLITHPSKPNISIKTYNLCSIENVCFLIYLTMDNKIQTTAININLWIHHFNFCAGGKRQLNLWSKSISGLVAVPPLMLDSGKSDISKWEWRYSIWAISTSSLKHSILGPNSDCLTCSYQDVSLLKHLNQPRLCQGQAAGDSCEIYLQSAHCEHARCYCGTLRQQHKLTDIIAALRQHETCQPCSVRPHTEQQDNIWLSCWARGSFAHLSSFKQGSPASLEHLCQPQTCISSLSTECTLIQFKSGLCYG